MVRLFWTLSFGTRTLIRSSNSPSHTKAINLEVVFILNFRSDPITWSHAELKRGSGYPDPCKSGSGLLNGSYQPDPDPTGPLGGVHPAPGVGPQCTGPGMHFRAKFFLQNLLALIQISFLKYFLTPPDLWGASTLPQG